MIFSGCSDDDNPTGPDQGAPAVSIAGIEINEYNNLSLSIRFNATGADSARVLYGPPGGPMLSTPRYAITDSPSRIATLGLMPETNYVHVVEVSNGAEAVSSDPTEAASGALPDYIADHVTFEITGTPPAGYIATVMRADPANRYLVMFDETGRVAWYRKFDITGGLLQQLPNGNFAAFLGLTQGFQPWYGYFAEISPSGEVLNRYQATAPLYTDGHELLMTPRDDGYVTHLFSYSLREFDMTPYGGQPDALIGGHQILRFAPSGTVEFSWNAWDHFSVADWIELPDSRRQADNADFDHPNALDLDHDGNYIASFRDLAEVTKIDSDTGKLIWRLGGANNQFTFLDDPLGGFNGQHSVRVMSDGHLLLYDNGLRHDPPESRAVEYELDLVNMTATMVWQYRHTPAVYTPFTGGVTRRTNGNTVVQFAAQALVVEVDPVGQVVWTGQALVDGGPVAMYRLNAVPSLYEYIRP